MRGSGGILGIGDGCEETAVRRVCTDFVILRKVERRRGLLTRMDDLRSWLVYYVLSVWHSLNGRGCENHLIVPYTFTTVLT